MTTLPKASCGIVLPHLRTRQRTVWRRWQTARDQPPASVLGLTSRTNWHKVLPDVAVDDKTIERAAPAGSVRRHARDRNCPRLGFARRRIPPRHCSGRGSHAGHVGPGCGHDRESVQSSIRLESQPRLPRAPCFRRLLRSQFPAYLSPISSPLRISLELRSSLLAALASGNWGSMAAISGTLRGERFR